jgi:hypothetical protein
LHNVSQSTMNFSLAMTLGTSGTIVPEIQFIRLAKSKLEVRYTI